MCVYLCSFQEQWWHSKGKYDWRTSQQRRALTKRTELHLSIIITDSLPSSSHLRILHDKHESGGLEFPQQLVPLYSATVKCRHGNQFNPVDPIQNHWISRKGAIIHNEVVTIEEEARTIYYRPSLGSCDCKQDYDSQDDLHFNLNDKHMPFLLRLLIPVSASDVRG